MKACPLVQKQFHQLVNMKPAEIRAWARDPRAKCASFQETRDRLTKPQKYRGVLMRSLADLKALPAGKWEDRDCVYAQRVISFNTRHLGQMKRFGCTTRETVALRNWGHMPKCPMPPSGCSTRPPKRG